MVKIIGCDVQYAVIIFLTIFRVCEESSSTMQIAFRYRASRDRRKLTGTLRMQFQRGFGRGDVCCPNALRNMTALFDDFFSTSVILSTDFHDHATSIHTNRLIASSSLVRCVFSVGQLRRAWSLVCISRALGHTQHHFHTLLVYPLCTQEYTNAMQNAICKDMLIMQGDIRRLSKAE